MKTNKERYLFPLRILVTLLILTMLLPGWGLLSASNAIEQQPAMSVDAMEKLSPSER
jgi:hypothetical protein